ncbi:phosphatidate cytidylyltransferase [Chitinophaga flava]|uniref:Phosphatidate cytidylyltransferase n=1 Tax=Chitinophaga flava TaxID=2259036 RepID=A0A365XY89_9BACT|nr:phosphatidate cytidylyltransferase [Chitinophaga flava]
MKRYSYLLISLLLSSCSIIGGIFKAGIWTGIFIVALVVILIIFLISRGSRRD